MFIELIYFKEEGMDCLFFLAPELRIPTCLSRENRQVAERIILTKDSHNCAELFLKFCTKMDKKIKTETDEDKRSNLKIFVFNFKNYLGKEVQENFKKFGYFNKRWSKLLEVA